MQATSCSCFIEFAAGCFVDLGSRLVFLLKINVLTADILIYFYTYILLVVRLRFFYLGHFKNFLGMVCMYVCILLAILCCFRKKNV